MYPCRVLLPLLCLFLAASILTAGEPAKDRRLGPYKDYNGYFPWTPPTNKAEWETRRKVVREQVLVANGLWPLPEKTPLNPVVHGKIERDGYTVEKVFFASYPGHYVSGNLYRPTKATGKLPAVLSPHGHWPNGRFFEAGEKEVDAQMKSGAESTREGAKYPLQARCAQLARLGCVVFHYDMVGYADSKQIEHRKGFLDVEAELRLQNFMGLQTWNSIRSLDFLLSLPDVDTTRVGCTGASGGGTQTFILSAIDDRVTAEFPAVMVSTAMQGGCICENCSYLRVGTGNIELAALFAPRPLGLSAANDWTKDIETKGLPELKALYKLYGAENNLTEKSFLQFGHNYAQPSREVMYNFFNRHLRLGHEGKIREQAFLPVPPKELSVYDAEHSLPNDAVGAEPLRRYMTEQAQNQLAGLVPKDAAGAAKSHVILGAALRSMVADSLPTADQVESDGGEEKTIKILAPIMKVGGGFISRKGQGEKVALVLATRIKGADGRVVIFVEPDMNDLPEREKEALSKVLDDGVRVSRLLPFRTTDGEKTPRQTTNLKIGSLTYSGYYYGYNRALVAERVHDILTAVAYARSLPGTKSVSLVGVREAGPWVLLASALCGDAVNRTAVDMNGFRFEQVKDFDDPMMLPGAVKYGGLPTLGSLVAPCELYLHNTKGSGPLTFLEAAYQASGAPDRLTRREERAEPAAVVEWLLRK